MGFWAGIKHAINSTLGQTDFQPLDQIIKGQKTIAPSDQILISLYSGGTTVDGLLGTFSFKTTGQARLYVKATGSTGSYFPTVQLIDENNVTVAEFKFNTTAMADQIMTCDFTIIYGKKYRINVRNTANVKKIDVCGTIIDGSLFEYEVKN